MQRIFQLLLRSEKYVAKSPTKRTRFIVNNSSNTTTEKKVSTTAVTPLHNPTADLTTTTSKTAPIARTQVNFCAKDDQNHNKSDEFPNQLLLKTSKKIKKPFTIDNNMSITEDFQRLEEKLSGLRQWEYTPDWDQYVKYPSGNAFTLLSYNLLAQSLLEAHRYLYQNHDKRALSWKHRYNRLVQEILSINPQILCLQEVQESHLESLHHGLSTLDLKVLYKKRTGYKDDGCAIFYNHKQFNLIEYHTIEYYQPGIQLLNRENVAIVAKFSPKSDPDCTFVVATTHLLYNPRRQDVRLAQVQVLLAELDRIAYNTNCSKYDPVILTGDFNLRPHSAPYKLLTQGSLKYDTLTPRTLEKPNPMYANDELIGKYLLPPKLGITDECRHLDVVESNIRNQTKLHHTDKIYLVEETDDIPKTSTDDSAEPNAPFCTGELRHKFKFTSTYQHKLSDGEPEASTFQDNWITVDYIFYSGDNDNSQKDSLQLLSRYKLPSVSRCTDMGMVPNLYFGSDHLSLAAKFLIKPNTENS